ncbi:PEP-CTERM sorting domain-containing protein [Massilia sp. W12]|uniref:PEP-CTERM sorting domain-containing protein n=1 Tax=Massilia sp. W12 TaxID=3126507 RepID=UPI0030D603A9
MQIKKIIAALALASASASAFAFPIAIPGTEGLKVFATGNGPVIAKYEGNSAGYSNDLFLGSLFIFNNHASPVGSTVNLGSFTPGTELVFRLHVNNTGDDFYTGDASRNIDNLFHARVQANWQPGVTLVSFEDLRGTPEGANGFNDLSFSFTNTNVTPIPEAETWAMMLGGLSVLGAMARRRKAK